MSYSRTLDRIEQDIQEESKDSPCEASYLMLMRGVARGWTPKSLEIREMVIDDFANRMRKVNPKKEEQYCEELTKLPNNLIQTVNAISIGNATRHLGTQEANKAAAQGSEFLKNYQHSLERCRGKFFTPNEERKHTIDSAIAAAQSTRENLEDFQKMHQRCVNENQSDKKMFKP